MDYIEGRKYVLLDADGSTLPRCYKYIELSKIDPREVEGRLREARRRRRRESTRRW